MKKIITLAAALYILASASNSAQAQNWKVIGNNGTNPLTEFIGTTDNKNFNVRTNNSVRITVTANGNTGIGTNIPAFKLDVKNGSINTDSVYRIGGTTVLSAKGFLNIFSGAESGIANTTGSYNTAMGVSALESNTTGSSNAATGCYSLNHNTTASLNTATGNAALYYNTTGTVNSAHGAGALYYNTTGSYNTADGFSALFFNTTGDYNTASGIYALNGNTTGDYNTAVGSSALYSNTTGYRNTASGNSALYSNTTGYFNSAYGFEALYSNTDGYDNTANGIWTLFFNTTGIGNTANGFESLFYNTTGSSNTANGARALYYNTTGGTNTANGSGALFNNTSGGHNAAFGYFALAGNTTAQYNTAVGHLAGASYNNGWNNVFLGANTDVDGDDYYNVIAVGQGTIVGGSNTARFGNPATDSYGGWANWTNVSDGRFKKNIKENVPGIDFITKLRPVTYTLDATGLDAFLHKNDKGENKLSASENTIHQQALREKEKITCTGFIAQEVETAAKELGFDFSGVDAAKNDDDAYGLRYAEFVVPLVKAVQELNEANQKSEVRSQKLEEENEKLIQRIEKLESLLSEKTSSQASVTSPAYLEQNSPNPFSQKTEIKFYIPASSQTAVLKIYSADGKEIKSFTLSAKGEGQVEINANSFSPGIYNYTLFIDGKISDSRQMILTKQ